MNRLLLFFSIITALTLVSCGKTERVLSEEKSEPVELSQDYADLQNALLELNKEYSVSIPETRSFFRWLCVGICDAVGAACGYARGGIGGAIGLGCIASAIAIIEFSPMDNLQETVRDVTSTEAAFSTAAQSSGQPAGMQVGVYHNQILRAVFERQGASLSQMNEEEIALAIEREMKDMGLQEGWLAEVAEQYSLQDFKYSLEGDTSAEAYVGRLCSKYPFVGQELVVLRTVLEGFDSINNEDGLASYSESVIRIIAESAIQNEAKTTLISGTSVAFESKQLWNLSKSE